MSPTTMTFDEKRAPLEHDCPDCGAKTNVRCRILSPNRTAPGKTKVDVRAKPCSGRVQIAWREWMQVAR